MEFEKLPKGEIRQATGVQLISSLSDIDPSAACDLLQKEASPGAFGDYYTSRIFAAWAKTDPVAAAARLAAMSPDRVGTYSSAALAASWAQKDPAAALQWAKNLAGDCKSYSTSEVYKVISREDPQKAWEQLKGEPGHLRGNFLGNLNWNNTRLAFELIDQVKDSATRRESLGDQMYYAAWGTPDLLKAQVAKMTEREKIDISEPVLRG